MRFAFDTIFKWIKTNIALYRPDLPSTHSPVEVFLPITNTTNYREIKLVLL